MLFWKYKIIKVFWSSKQQLINIIWSISFTFSRLCLMYFNKSTFAYSGKQNILEMSITCWSCIIWSVKGGLKSCTKCQNLMELFRKIVSCFWNQLNNSIKFSSHIQFYVEDVLNYPCLENVLIYMFTFLLFKGVYKEFIVRNMIR